MCTNSFTYLSRGLCLIHNGDGGADKTKSISHGHSFRRAEEFMILDLRNGTNLPANPSKQTLQS